MPEPIQIPWFLMLRFLGKVAPLLLRKFLTEQKLQRYLNLDVSSSGDGVTFDYSSQEGSVWRTITNLSPFDLRMTSLTICCAFDRGGSFECLHVFPEQITANGTERILVRIRTPVVREVAIRAKDSKRVDLEIKLHVVSSIRSFTIHKRLTQITNFSIVNVPH